MFHRTKNMFLRQIVDKYQIVGKYKKFWYLQANFDGIWPLFSHKKYDGVIYKRVIFY